ncbi:ABC transporter substrate-binding protein [Catellatospora chokoriensis]|uniref:ABC transporter substrate-binding protein n=1 Tax=Catellatospora chokoriensis TaxID=310353 RepID=A0A8J3K584_9ACTN|nr:ABC transporter substrate-binding protein [Catellatospora chokoriensis]GIF94289.1 ABC transporter substrate-binding protein [Catellatospora chokoriensis]
MTSLRATLRSPHLRVHGPLAAAAACLLALTACSGTTGEPAAGQQAPKPIDSFTYGIPTPPSSLDLTKNMNGWTSAVAVMVTQPLERFDSAGQATPVLASKVTTPTDTSVVYDLRADVKFSDGKPLTAADVVAAVQHATDGAAGAQTASILTSIKDVKATGDAQVTVTLAHPDPAIRGSIAFGVLVSEADAMKRAGADYGTAAGLPVGTGPYVYSSFKADKVELTSNPAYQGTAPRIKKLTFAGFTADTTAQLALRSGAVQANYVNAPKTTPQWKSIAGATVYSTPSLLSTYLTFDTSKAPFNDVHARRAVAHLIDRTSLARVAYGDEAQVMRGMAPDAEFVPLAGSAAAVTAFMSGLPQVAYDPAAAAKELALSATPTGFSIDVPYPSSEPFAEPVLLSLQQAAKPLGITVNLKPQTFIAWATDIYMFKPAPLGVFQIGDLQPDPNGGMALMVTKANAAPTKFNMASWTPQEIEPLALTMTQSGDRAARWAAASSILTAAAEQLPYVPLFAPNTVLVYGKGYSSSTPPDFMAFITGAWLDTLTGNAA